MNVKWILPDRTTLESTVPNIDQLLFTLELVDSISINGVSYQSFQTKLIVDEGQFTIAITFSPKLSTTLSSFAQEETHPSI